MGKLSYVTNASLDGYIEDEQGEFDWSEPTEDLHRYFNMLEARYDLMLYGRRLYETMAVWESDDMFNGMPNYIQEFAQIWRRGEKTVYSRTLTEVTTARTTLRAKFEPDEVRRLKAARAGDISIGGAILAGEAMAHCLVDEIYLLVHPVIVGAGKPAFRPGIKSKLILVETRSFDGGVVLLHYSLNK